MGISFILWTLDVGSDFNERLSPAFYTQRRNPQDIKNPNSQKARPSSGTPKGFVPDTTPPRDVYKAEVYMTQDLPEQVEIIKQLQAGREEALAEL